MKEESIRKAVIKEIKNIKKFATEDEISKLKNRLEFLRSNVNSQCVYGLMTGSCFSPRAHELIEKCSSIYKSDSNQFSKMAETILNIEQMEQIKFVKHKQRKNDTFYFSPLENLLYIEPDWIKEKIKELL